MSIISHPVLAIVDIQDKTSLFESPLVPLCYLKHKVKILYNYFYWSRSYFSSLFLLVLAGRELPLFSRPYKCIKKDYSKRTITFEESTLSR